MIQYLPPVEDIVLMGHMDRVPRKEEGGAIALMSILEFVPEDLAEGTTFSYLTEESNRSLDDLRLEQTSRVLSTLAILISETNGTEQAYI